jgi:hypothetical protein
MSNKSKVNLVINGKNIELSFSHGAKGLVTYETIAKLADIGELNLCDIAFKETAEVKKYDSRNDCLEISLGATAEITVSRKT